MTRERVTHGSQAPQSSQPTTHSLLRRAGTSCLSWSTKNRERSFHQPDSQTSPPPPILHEFSQTPVHASYSDSINQTGIPTLLLRKMERSFGQDFSNVRIHTNAPRTKELAAKAYTQGSEIYFAPNRFKPHTLEGQKLLGHELTHVIQQRRGNVRPTQDNYHGFGVNHDSGLERQADSWGTKVARGELVNAQPQTQSINASASAPIQMENGLDEFVNLIAQKLGIEATIASIAVASVDRKIIPTQVNKWPS